jgi:hypothetical protein
MKSIDARIEKHVDAFVGDLQQLVRDVAVAAVSHALGQKRAPQKRRSGVKRKPEVLAELTERLYRAVCASPGASMRTLGETVELSPRELQLPAQRLLRDGRIKKTGQRDQTRYFPVGREPKRKRRGRAR